MKTKKKDNILSQLSYPEQYSPDKLIHFQMPLIVFENATLK
jgi:hypothetical protein